MEQVHGAFGKVAKDMNKLKIKQMKTNETLIEKKKFHQMGGSGIHMEMKRFYQKIMDENSNLIKDLKETQKTVDVIQQHTFFKEQLKETDKLKKEIINIEKSFINAMEIKAILMGI